MRKDVERRLSSLEADLELVAAATAAEAAADTEPVVEWIRWLVGRRLLAVGDAGRVIPGPGPIGPVGDEEWHGYDSTEGRELLREVAAVLNDGAPLVLLTAEERARALAELAAGKWQMRSNQGAWYAAEQPLVPACPPFRAYPPDEHTAYCASTRLAADVALAARWWAAQTGNAVPGDLAALARWLALEHELLDELG